MTTRGSHLRWRRHPQFLAILLLVGFVSNEIWEVAQMYAYIRASGSSSMSEFLRCSRAAVGDAVIILGICAVGALASGDPGWGMRGKWNVYGTSSVLGLIYATLMELWSVAAGRWSYSERMPLVPMLDVGLWPLLQLTVLPPLSFWLARWWTTRNPT